MGGVNGLLESDKRLVRDFFRKASLGSTRENSRISAARTVVELIVAWAWALVAGVSDLALLVHKGALPITNGWFAMLSGVEACPLTALIL